MLILKPGRVFFLVLQSFGLLRLRRTVLRVLREDLARATALSLFHRLALFIFILLGQLLLLFVLYSTSFRLQLSVLGTAHSRTVFVFLNVGALVDGRQGRRFSSV